MLVLRGLNAITPALRGCVATIGNFDGVHRGHQALLQRLCALSAERQLSSLVILFEPHPQEFFNTDAPPRLMTLREKLEHLRALGVDRVLCLRFNEGLAAMSAEDFICEVLISTLEVQHLVIGDDFHFGHRRRGNFALLKMQTTFVVEASPTVKRGQDRVSSTAIRQALLNAEFVRARQLLGHAFVFSGRVVHGDKNGRQLGFPTANLLLQRRTLPMRGVFAVQVQIARDGAQLRLNGVANIGTRPTLNGSQMRLEVHLFDFDGDLYGLRITVEPIAKLRDEQKFVGLDALKKQIALDATQARALFSVMAHDE